MLNLKKNSAFVEAENTSTHGDSWMVGTGFKPHSHNTTVTGLAESFPVLLGYRR